VSIAVAPIAIIKVCDYLFGLGVKNVCLFSLRVQQKPHLMAVCWGQQLGKQTCCIMGNLALDGHSFH